MPPPSCASLSCGIMPTEVCNLLQVTTNQRSGDKIQMIPTPDSLQEALSGPEPEHCSTSLLKRPLYCPKQLLSQWHTRLMGVLRSMGFQPAHGNPHLFLLQQGNLWFPLYLQGLLLLSSSQAEPDHLKASPKPRSPMQDLGEVSNRLGMQVTRVWGKQEVYLSQAKSVPEVVNTPLEVTHGLKTIHAEEPTVPEPNRYPELLGLLMYLIVCSWSAIAHSLSVLSSFVACGKHGVHHWKAALRLLGCVRATAHYRLALSAISPALVGHSAASWADDPDTYRFNQGFCFSMRTGVMSWQANRYPSVTLSTFTAQLYAATVTAQVGLWFIALLQLLGCPQTEVPPTHWCTIEGTALLTQGPVFSSRSKHFAARYFSIKKLVQRAKLLTAHILGASSVADISLKALSQEDHSRLWGRWALTSPLHSSCSGSRGCVAI